METCCTASHNRHRQCFRSLPKLACSGNCAVSKSICTGFVDLHYSCISQQANAIKQSTTTCQITFACSLQCLAANLLPTCQPSLFL